MSQWPNWLRRQYGKLEICGSNPGDDTNFSFKNDHLFGVSNSPGSRAEYTATLTVTVGQTLVIP